MASPLNDEDSKVMDVSKPGKGKVVPTSRPVVGSIVSEEKSAPSATRKVIKPLSDTAEESSGIVSVDTPAESDSPVVDSVMPEAKDAVEPATPEEAPAEPADSTPATDDLSDAASVDALAESAETKRQAAKKAEEQAKLDAEIDELISSKKYFVNIGHGLDRSSKKPLLILVILLTLVAAGTGYYYWTTLNSDDDNSSTSAQTESNSEQSNQAEESAEDEEAESTEETSEPGNTAADIASRDTDRKNELKNLQQKLETYFNDNDEYPATLNDLSLSEDELTGPRGDAYSYAPASDQQSYVLAAELENSQDKDADGNGLYVLQSVNQ